MKYPHLAGYFPIRASIEFSSADSSILRYIFGDCCLPSGVMMKRIEQFFETLLWNSRFVVVIPVFFSMILSFGIFASTSIDVFALLGAIGQYLDPTLTSDTRAALQIQNIGRVVAIVDNYLLAAIMLIFALGLYELFVNKIDAAENTELAKRLLLIRSMDDLKDRLANLVLLILIVKFFQQALKISYTSTVDLLILAVGVVLIAGALYLSGRAKPAKTGGESA